MATATTTQPARAGKETRGQEGPRVLAVVVTHGGRAWIRDCLVALANQDYPLLDVLVVDDASPDSRHPPSLRRVAKRHLRRRRWGYLRTPRPLGFGGAINWALSRVRTDADFLLFVHDDAALAPGSVARMVERLAFEERTAVVGPKIVSWDDEEVLEEVGMAVDRFGYPYKGLEEREIDLGQHDRPSEVFYVSSTCMLVRHDVFRQLRGFDARLRAYSEDLDLCWRARLRGHAVRLEPQAVARHVVAMARGHRRTRYRPARYFSRRNRLRVVAKNASGARLLVLFPSFFVLAFAEMLAFLVLRQPAEVANLARALLWNLVHLPQTLSERRRVQRQRAVSDRVLMRLTVREGARLRVYLAHQAGRLEEAWGRRAELVAARTGRARALAGGLRAWHVVPACVLLALLALGMRHFLWAPPAAVGELLPFPHRGVALFEAWASPWQGAGLGAPGPAPPALFALGVVNLLALGSAGAAQKLLVLLLGVVALTGAARLVGEAVDPPGRAAAGLVYALGAVGYAGLRGGALGALVFGALAPHALVGILRLTGWVRPPRWSAAREVARLALAGALAGAFVPGALLALGGAALVCGLLRAPLGRGREGLAGLARSGLGLALAWGLLLPWSARWLQPDGPLGVLWGRRSGVFASSYEGADALGVLLGHVPEGPALYGFALPVLGLVAVVAGRGQRRRLGLVLWAVVAAGAALVSLTASGRIPPVLATPTEAGVLPGAAFAGLAGVAVGGFRLDLVRRQLGAVHLVAIGGLAAGALLLVAGFMPATLAGAWAPGAAAPAWTADAREQVRTLLQAEARDRPPFRALWIGPAWTGAPPTAASPAAGWFVTSGRGQELTDLFASPGSAGARALEAALGAVRAGRTDRAGRLLAGFNIRFVVVQRAPGASAWLRQRDLAVARSGERFFVLEVPRPAARAGLYAGTPDFLTAGRAPAADGVVERAVGIRRSPALYALPDVRGPGTVFLSESADRGWSARLGGRELPRSEGGWANAFTLPAGVGGDVELSYSRPFAQAVALVLMPLVWLLVVGAAFPSRPRTEASQ